VYEKLQTERARHSQVAVGTRSNEDGSSSELFFVDKVCRVKMPDGSYQYKVGKPNRISRVLNCPEQIFWSGHSKPTIEPWEALDFSQQQLLIVKFGPNVATDNWKRPQNKRKKRRKSIQGRKKALTLAQNHSKRKQSAKQSEAADIASSQHQTEMQELQTSIDDNWKTKRAENKEHVEMFPELPSQQRVKDSIADFRLRMSTPHLSQLCCGVCGELWNVALIRSFTIGDSFLSDKNFATLRVLLKAVHAPATFADGPFTGMALCDKGVNSDAGTINVCKRCYHSLNKLRRTPHLAISNNLDFGEIPPELLDLSWAEERVISLLRICLHVLNLRGHESPSHRDDTSILHQQMKLTGHSFCVVQDTHSVNKAIPLHPDELPDIIQVRHSICSSDVCANNLLPVTGCFPWSQQRKPRSDTICVRIENKSA